MVWVGQGEPYQRGAVANTSPYFNEKLAKQYTEFDVKKANEFLDSAQEGRQRHAHDAGWLAFEHHLGDLRHPPSTAEAGAFRQGIDMQPKVMDRALMYTRKDAQRVRGNGLGRGWRPGCGV